MPNHFALSLLCSNFVPFYQEQGGGRGGFLSYLSFPYIIQDNLMKYYLMIVASAILMLCACRGEKQKQQKQFQWIPFPTALPPTASAPTPRSLQWRPMVSSTTLCIISCAIGSSRRNALSFLWKTSWTGKQTHSRGRVEIRPRICP